jgi:DNA invertase Pin-like site-specific DNA recombinase
LLVRFQKDGIHFCSLSEGINTTTPGGKLTFHLFSAVAEFQRDIIVENTVFGIEAARKRGKQIGRPYSLTPDTIVGAHSAMMQDGLSKAEIAKLCGVSRMTIDRAFMRLRLNV